MAPVAEDRHIAGAAFELRSRQPPGQPVRLGEAEVKVWYFERADVLYRSLRPALRPDRITPDKSAPARLARQRRGGRASYADLDWADEAGDEVEKDDTTGPLRHLAGEYTRLTASRTRWEPARSGRAIPGRAARPGFPAPVPAPRPTAG